jgi:O-antigen/teichoic acid export membrane protein
VDSLLSASSRISFALFSLLVLVSLGRFLTEEDLARFAYIDSIKLLICAAPVVGLTQAYIKNYRLNNYDITSFYASLKLLSTYLLIFISIYIISCSLILSHYPTSYISSNTCLVGLMFFISNIIYLYIRGILLGAKNTKHLFLYETTLLLTFVFVLVFIRADYWQLETWLIGIALCMLTPVTYAAINFSLIFPEEESCKPSEKNKNTMRDQLEYFKYSFINNISTNSFSITDSFILGATLGPLALANYKAAKIIMAGYYLAGDIVNSIIFPKFAHFHFDTYNGKKEIIAYIPILIVGVFACWLFLHFFATDLISILYASKYDNNETATLLFYMPIWGGLFMLTRAFASYVGAIGLPSILMKTTIISGAVSIIALYVLTKATGIQGVGISMLINAGLPAILVYLFSRAYLK